MGAKNPWMVKQFVMATQRLHDSRLYERYCDSDYFLIRTPKLDEPAVAVLMGYGQQAYGLNLFLGPSALASCEAMLSAANEDHAYAHLASQRGHVLGYDMCRASEMTYENRRWLKKAGVRTSVKSLYPDPMVVRGGARPVFEITDREVRLLLHVVRGILAASADRAFRPCGIDRKGRVLCVELDESVEDPKATVGWTPVRGDGVVERGAALERDADPARVQPRFDLSGLRCNGDVWFVGVMPIPGTIEGDDRQPLMMFVASEGANGVWPQLLMQSEPQEIADALAELMLGRAKVPELPAGAIGDGVAPPPKGLPKVIVLDSTVDCAALQPAFEPLGVHCHDGKNDPRLCAMFDVLHEAIVRGFGDELPEDLSERPVPDAGDVCGWKEVDGWIKDTIHRGFDGEDRYHNARALKRYFGPNVDAEALLEQLTPQLIVDAYAHWFAVHYRPSRRKPTLAEQWLGSAATPEAVKPLLRAVIDRGPSCYRIEGVDAEEGLIEFVDVFNGDRADVTDFAMSTCVTRGMILPAKIVPAGDFHLVYAAGPIMQASQFQQAMGFLEDRGVDPSTEQFHAHPHQLGLLWEFMAKDKPLNAELRNSDGHLLALHTAVFSCSDPSVLARFLDGRADWNRIADEPIEWDWFRPGVLALHGGDDRDDHAAFVVDAQIPTPGEPLTALGHAQLEGDRLTLSVNSQERFNTAREILERVEGVALASVDVESLPRLAELRASQGDADEGPRAERGEDADPHPPSADEVASIRDYLYHYYYTWLDDPMPALDGKSPREAAKSAKLRPKVSALIRTIPDPMGSPGNVRIEVPREALLAELGLS